MRKEKQKHYHALKKSLIEEKKKRNSEIYSAHIYIYTYIYQDDVINNLGRTCHDVLNDRVEGFNINGVLCMDVGYTDSFQDVLIRHGKKAQCFNPNVRGSFRKCTRRMAKIDSNIMWSGNVKRLR